jgi:hypothetical protein
MYPLHLRLKTHAPHSCRDGEQDRYDLVGLLLVGDGGEKDEVGERPFFEFSITLKHYAFADMPRLFVVLDGYP